MPKEWTWDETLFLGSAAFYARGRLPYPPLLADRFESAADLTGRPRLIDVGCGPGTVALLLAHLFVEVVGVDPDADMLAEAQRFAAKSAIANCTWVKLRAEDLPAGLGSFRYATLAQSFHWMDRSKVASSLFRILEPGGAFVHVNTVVAEPAAPAPLPHPAPPKGAMTDLVIQYLGAERRAGQGIRRSSPGNEGAVLTNAGFRPAQKVPVPGRQMLVRTIDDIVADVFSTSSSAPHLFGDRLGRFETELRTLLEATSEQGLFSEWLGDIQLDFYERP